MDPREDFTILDNNVYFADIAFIDLRDSISEKLEKDERILCEKCITFPYELGNSYDLCENCYTIFAEMFKDSIQTDVVCSYCENIQLNYTNVCIYCAFLAARNYTINIKRECFKAKYHYMTNEQLFSQERYLLRTVEGVKKYMLISSNYEEQISPMSLGVIYD